MRYGAHCTCGCHSPGFVTSAQYAGCCRCTTAFAPPYDPAPPPPLDPADVLRALGGVRDHRCPCSREPQPGIAAPACTPSPSHGGGRAYPGWEPSHGGWHVRPAREPSPVPLWGWPLVGAALVCGLARDGVRRWAALVGCR